MLSFAFVHTFQRLDQRSRQDLGGDHGEDHCCLIQLREIGILLLLKEKDRTKRCRYRGGDTGRDGDLCWRHLELPPRSALPTSARCRRCFDRSPFASRPGMPTASESPTVHDVKGLVRRTQKPRSRKELQRNRDRDDEGAFPIPKKKIMIAVRPLRSPASRHTLIAPVTKTALSEHLNI